MMIVTFNVNCTVYYDTRWLYIALKNIEDWGVTDELRLFLLLYNIRIPRKKEDAK